MSTAIGEKRLSIKRAERDVRQPARQSKAHPDCRSATIKSRLKKISLALSPGRDNHPLAATAKMAILIVAVFSSRLSRYKIRRIAIRLARNRIQPAHIVAWSLWRRAHQAAAQRAHFKCIYATVMLDYTTVRH